MKINSDFLFIQFSQQDYLALVKLRPTLMTTSLKNAYGSKHIVFIFAFVLPTTGLFHCITMQ